MSKAWPWFGAAGAVVVADQLTKWIVLASLSPGDELRVTPFFNLVLTFNRGVAFSFLVDAPPWVLIAFALAAAAVVAVMLVRASGGRMLRAGLALVLGGALGNVIDRLRIGRVVDFLDFYIAGLPHWPAFNVADSAITVGALLLILDSFVRRETAPGTASYGRRPE